MTNNPPRTLVIGDIHGALKALEQVLILADATPQDTLIFLGDYVDGWSEPLALLNFLIALQKKQNCIFIRGNHDELFLKWLTQNTQDFDEKMWLHHGGNATKTAYQNCDSKTKKQHINFLQTLHNYHIDNKNRLFVHAGFTNKNGVKHEHFPKMLYWDRTLWETALALNPNLCTTDILYPKRLQLYPEIFIGHTPVTQINQTQPINKACIWNVDTGAAFKGVLTIMDIDTKEFWQSNPVHALYPNEKGRN